MKYSLSSRQTAEYLRKADEIRVEYRDHKIIPDLAEKYPQATVNLTTSSQDDIDWKEIKVYNTLCRGNFSIGITTMDHYNQARETGVKYYYRYPITTFQELQDAKAAGMCCVLLGAPLFFMMDKVKRFDMPVRAVANVAHTEAHFTEADGTIGTWIRPEDVELYEPYVEVIEFMDNITAEQALYRIYAENHKWSNPLSYIVKDLGHEATNRMIPPDLAKARLNCGQRCMENGRCHLCRNTLNLANPELIQKILDSKEQI